MSQPVPPEQSESTPTKSSGRRLPRLPQLGRSRWLALGVGGVLLGGAVVGAAAVADHDRGERGDRKHIEAVRDWKGGDRGELRTRGEDRGESGYRNDESRTRQNTGSDQDGQSGLAPAPVPAVSAATAIEAAGKAVPGGKPDALRVVAQQGGGSAWEVEVLGADGVRHLVTLDGATGKVTGNTVASAAQLSGR